VSTVVNGTELALLSNSTTAPFFNGARPTGSIDFSKGGAPLSGLTDGLVRFFGGALGCTDNTISKYTGAALDVIHRPMGISTLVFDTFNELLIGITAGAGVVAADNQAILSVLQSTKALIVFPPTICDKYSTLLGINNFLLVSTVVNGTEVGLLGNATTLPFFNGATPTGSTDFTKGGPALSKLTNGLITFFGQYAVLGCTDGTIGKYTGLALDVIHQPMIISGLVFDSFNQILLKVTASAGVTAPDNAAILSVLETTRVAVVKQATVPTAPSGGGPGGGSRTYEVGCGPAPLVCGGGGVYSLTQTLPTRGPTLGDPDITCFAGEVITFSFPTALPTHPFQIIDNTGAPYPGSPSRFSSTGSVSFACTSAMSTSPAYYTCLNHGGLPGAAMTGNFVLVNAPPGNNPPSGPGTTPNNPNNPSGTAPYDGLSGGAVVGILIAIFFVLIVVTALVTLACVKVVLKR
jgi:hypothetical protein